MNSTLLIFGCPSWKDWVDPFFVNTSEAVDYIFDKDLSDSAVARLTSMVRAHRAERVILVSHHDTLMRDAKLGGAIQKIPEKSCVFQPRHVSSLATNKRQMNEYAARVPHIGHIQEIEPEDIEEQLSLGEGPLVAKQIGLTEGHLFSILHDLGDFEQFLTSQKGNLDQFMFQRFVQGIEYSVNAVAVEDRIVAFQPISKSLNTSNAWDHPCRRLRRCPEMNADQELVDKLTAATIDYMKTIGAQGLVELEFIVDHNRAVWFLEINPRLSATTRMVSIVSEIDVFTALIKLTREPHVGLPATIPTTGFSEEFPIPKSISKKLLTENFSYPEYSFSSRATVSGKSEAELQNNVRFLRNYMNG